MFLEKSIFASTSRTAGKKLGVIWNGNLVNLPLKHSLILLVCGYIVLMHDHLRNRELVLANMCFFVGKKKENLDHFSVAWEWC